MLWGLADHFVDELIQIYRTREQAERALANVLRDEPEWKGMMEVVPIPGPPDGHWAPKGRQVGKTRCRGY